MAGDESASFVEEPFRDREKATAGFRENASVSNAAGLPNYILVVLSHGWTSENAANENVVKVSQLVYNFFS